MESQRERSGEEEDLLARSTKKIKSTDLALVEDDDQIMTENLDVEGAAAVDGEDTDEEAGAFDNGVEFMRDAKEATETVMASREKGTVPSFRDMVRGENRAKTFDEEDIFGALNNNDGLLEVSTVDSWPAIKTSPKMKQFLHHKWRNCLIVKLLGRNIGYKTLQVKVTSLWKPRGHLELIELGEGYFVAKFSLEEDLQFALAEAWVRFPELPTEYYDERFLLALGNTIGRAIKVDKTTHFASRGKFARVCVEIDLNKKLVPKVMVDDQWTRVEYEGLPLFCFHCGYIGHRDCKEFKEQLAEQNGNGNNAAPANNLDVNGESSSDKAEEKVPEVQPTFGPWMVAQTRRSRMPVRKNTEFVRKPNGVGENATGSRYAALANIQEQETVVQTNKDKDISDKGFVAAKSHGLKTSSPTHGMTKGKPTGAKQKEKTHEKDNMVNMETRFETHIAGAGVSGSRTGGMGYGGLGFSLAQPIRIHDKSGDFEDSDVLFSGDMMIDGQQASENSVLGGTKVTLQHSPSLRSSDHRNRDPPNSSGLSVVPETQLIEGNMTIDYRFDSGKMIDDVASPGEHGNLGRLNQFS
ncbi:hypothetical protein CCACVL1_03127 [Corchorus capsularis]|uniref:DUF4283 domain-containing protein n=1 Tax=Corchorus capsularis TaxID=210143 RepID=A0A1R3K2F1_COCAP|nr:hypothetical protein CCACVL1_03127 [Corchorus capsularis]